jgi:predicted nuclease with TOPRIM domain
MEPITLAAWGLNTAICSRTRELNQIKSSLQELNRKLEEYSERKLTLQRRANPTWSDISEIQTLTRASDALKLEKRRLEDRQHHVVNKIKTVSADR